MLFGLNAKSLHKVKPQFSRGPLATLGLPRSRCTTATVSRRTSLCCRFIANYHWRSHISGELKIPGKQRKKKRKKIVGCYVTAAWELAASQESCSIKLRKLGWCCVLQMNYSGSPCRRRKKHQPGLPWIYLWLQAGGLTGLGRGSDRSGSWIGCTLVELQKKKHGLERESETETWNITKRCDRNVVRKVWEKNSGHSNLEISGYTVTGQYIVEIEMGWHDTNGWQPKRHVRSPSHS